MKFKIRQHIDEAGAERLGRLEQLLVLLQEPAAGPWPDFPFSAELRRQRERCKEVSAPVIVADLPTAASTRAGLALFKIGQSPFERLTLARRLVAPMLEQEARDIGIFAVGFADQAAALAAVEAVLAALFAAGHPLPSFKSEQAAAPRLATCHVYGLTEKANFARVQAEAEGNNLARYLTALPGNQLTPRHYLSWVGALARQHGWKLTFHDQKALTRKKAGAFLAVAQGSGDADAGIVHLNYAPARSSRKPPVALVGKGICFDTGGLNLKPTKAMHNMHQDMAGSAVALGTLLALTLLKVDFPVDCWLALAQNSIGPQAYKQNDVITAANGTTIEIVHTDAEGRLVLSDTLVLAGQAKPGLVIDYATLTYGAVMALGTVYSAAFSNRPELLPQLTAAGQASGERVWPFPLDADYDELLESEVADIKQCTTENEADHILAARFLSRFVPTGLPWVHLDLAAAGNKGGLAHVPTEVTGFGVRYTLSLLLDQQINAG